MLGFKVAATIAASITQPHQSPTTGLRRYTHDRVPSILQTLEGYLMAFQVVRLRQILYSMCRFGAYDESKKILGAGKDAPACKLAAAGSMEYTPGGIAGFIGNPRS